MLLIFLILYAYLLYLSPVYTCPVFAYTNLLIDLLQFISSYSNIVVVIIIVGGRCRGLMVGALVSGASGPGPSPGQGHCVVFVSKTLHSHSASFHPAVQMGTCVQQI